tara:strand:+ start:173 stop:346 length:174 start_codon:yes stop_codon:yes gene_type:complete
MTPYIERDASGDMTIRDADTNRAICYMPPTGPASGVKAKDRRVVEKNAEAIVSALST